MSKRKQAADTETEDRLYRAEVLIDKAIINGHVLAHGTVVELTMDEIVSHRAHGLALGEVADDDTRDVVNVRSPYEGAPSE